MVPREGFYGRPGHLCSTSEPGPKATSQRRAEEPYGRWDLEDCKLVAHFGVHGSLDLEVGLGWVLEFHPLCRWGLFQEQQVLTPNCALGPWSPRKPSKRVK